MPPARQADLRERNLATVLAAVAAGDPPPSRAHVAARTGLTRATVSALVESLVQGGLVREQGRTAQAAAGRPGAALTLGSDVAGLGVEIGVDHLTGVVRDLTGAVRGRRVLAGDRRGSPSTQVLADSVALAEHLLDQARSQGLRVVGAAWAVPGLVDGDGCVRLAPNLGWADVQVGAFLAARPTLAGLDPVVDNEANLALVGEVWRPGAGLRRAHGMLRVSGEVGIGAATLLHGDVLRGQRGWGGELGHLSVHPDGPRCSCGATGCLEVYAGQEALLTAAGLPSAVVTTSGQDAGPLADLLAAAEAADPRALGALAGAGRALGIAVAGAVNLLDVDEVVLGGIYAVLAEYLTGAVSAEVSRRALRSRLAPVQVRASRLGAEAAVLGAAASVLQRVLDEPGRHLGPSVAVDVRTLAAT